MTKFMPTSAPLLNNTDAVSLAFDQRTVEDSTLEPEYMEWNETTSSTSEEPYDIAFELPFLISVCVTGFLGNTLVIMVYSKRKSRRSNAAMYILNLAASKSSLRYNNIC